MTLIYRTVARGQPGPRLPERIQRESDVVFGRIGLDRRPLALRGVAPSPAADDSQHIDVFHSAPQCPVPFVFIRGIAHDTVSCKIA